MELEKISTWEDYLLIQPWLSLFFSFNGPISDYNLPLRIVLWNGRAIDLGEFKQPKMTVRLKGWSSLWLLLRPNLNAVGEAYMKGDIDIEGDLEDIVSIGFKLVEQINPVESRFERYTRFFDHSRLFDRQSIQHHYDVSNDFYRLWLDEHMVYSCAYFETGKEDLGEAQIKKIDHILTKVQLQPGHRLIDIGCGWGALVLRAAEKFGAKCVGITISEAQYDLAIQRVAEKGLQDRVEIRLQDYRDIDGQYDRVISVGMYEHVGAKHLVEYFAKVNSLLKPEGMALNHGLNARGDTGFSGGTEFVQRYIFPGSYLPQLSEAVKAAEDGGFEILDIENLRRHYTQTMICWARNYEKNGKQIRELVDESKYRAWRMYLGGSVQSFVNNNVTINQLLLHKAGRHPQTMPRSRRYIYKNAL